MYIFFANMLEESLCSCEILVFPVVVCVDHCTIQLPRPSLPGTPFHSLESCPTLSLQSLKLKSLSSESACCKRLCRLQ